MKGAVPSPPDDVPLGMLCDLVASLFRFDAAVKQQLLEELDVAGLIVTCDAMHCQKKHSKPPPSRTPI